MKGSMNPSGLALEVVERRMSFLRTWSVSVSLENIGRNNDLKFGVQADDYDGLLGSSPKALILAKT